MNITDQIHAAAEARADRRHESTEGPREEAFSILAGPAGTLAVATGWVPVSSAEALCRDWQNREQSHRGGAARETFSSSGDMRHTYAADAYKACVAMLRREIAAAIVRQPAPNIAGQPRRSEA